MTYFLIRAAHFLYRILRGMTFRVATAHGLSEGTYKVNEDPLNPGQGSGQGFGSGPILWLSTGDATMGAYKRLCPGAAIIHPAAPMTLVHEDHSDIYV